MNNNNDPENENLPSEVFNTESNLNGNTPRYQSTQQPQ